jgi:hypothetical protein
MEEHPEKTERRAVEARLIQLHREVMGFDPPIQYGAREWPLTSKSGARRGPADEPSRPGRCYRGRLQRQIWPKTPARALS